MAVSVTRKDTKFIPDPSRIIARFCNFSNEKSKNLIRSHHFIKPGSERLLKATQEYQ